MGSRSALLFAVLAAFGLQDAPPLPKDTLPRELPLEAPLGFPDELVAPAGNEFTSERTELGLTPGSFTGSITVTPAVRPA